MKPLPRRIATCLAAFSVAAAGLAAAAATAQAAAAPAARPDTTLSICANSPIPTGYVITLINTAAPSCDGYSGYFIKEA